MVMAESLWHGLLRLADVVKAGRARLVGAGMGESWNMFRGDISSLNRQVGVKH